MKSEIVNTPKIPDLSLRNIEKLCLLEPPYLQSTESDQLFVQAMKENIFWHQSKNPFYSRLCQISGFQGGDLKSIEDCQKIPMIPALFFKTHETLSVEKEKICLNLTSSGTSGQKSQMFFDDWSIHAPQKMVEFIFKFYQWINPEVPTNYLLYSYEVEPDSKLGTAYTDHFLCGFAKVKKVFTALRATGKSTHEFDVFGSIQALVEFEKDQSPVRIFGFPSFLYATLMRMKDLKMEPLKLSPQSFVFLGGGWKGAQNQAISSRELYQLINEMLGVPMDRIRDGYGSVEHCIPYVECSNHEFHVPVWSKVIIRNVETLEPQPFYKEGFLNLISPYITSVPAQSVLMDDLASLFPGKDCPCGLATPFFRILGRAGTSKNKSCAIAAAELLKSSLV